MHFPEEAKFALANALVNAQFAAHEDASFSDRQPLEPSAAISPKNEGFRPAFLDARGIVERLIDEEREGHMKLIWAAMALMVCATPAAAQMGDQMGGAGGHLNGGGGAGTQEGLRPDRDSPENFRIYTQTLGSYRCSTNIGRNVAERVLNETVESADERHDLALMRERFASCYVGGQTGILWLQRGGISENMYHKIAKAAPTYAGLQKSDPGYLRFIANEETRNSLRFPDEHRMVNTTNCLVARQPVLVHEFLETKHGSREEDNLLTALFTAAPDCGGPRPARVGRTYLRAFLAESAYRFAKFRVQKPIS